MRAGRRHVDKRTQLCGRVAAGWVAERRMQGISLLPLTSTALRRAGQATCLLLARAPHARAVPTDGAACVCRWGNHLVGQGRAGAAGGAASALQRFQAENGVQDVDADAIYRYDRVEQVLESQKSDRGSRACRLWV